MPWCSAWTRRPVSRHLIELNRCYRYGPLNRVVGPTNTCEHGTRTLLVSLDIGTGRVIAHVRERLTSKDFLAFLDSVVKEYPNQRLAIVLDNLNTHTNEAARKWLETHQLVSFHYTPTHASWVNLIECFFSILTRQGLEQAVHQSGKELEIFLKSFIQEYNKRCGPFEWAKGREKLRRIIELTEQWQSQ